MDNVPEEHYEVACEVFNETREMHFKQGSIDNSYNKEKGIDVVKNIQSQHYKSARKVFEATRIAYFDLGSETRKALRCEQIVVTKQKVRDKIPICESYS